MPELPEVETIVNDLRPLVEGRSIAKVELLFPRAVERPSPEAFIEAVEGKRIAWLRRRGKYILLELDDGSVLAVHLRLTGRLLFNARTMSDTSELYSTWTGATVWSSPTPASWAGSTGHPGPRTWWATWGRNRWTNPSPPKSWPRD